MEHAAVRDMETSAPAGKSQLEGALVGKGSAGEGSHCGQGTESCLEESLHLELMDEERAAHGHTRGVCVGRDL